MVYSMILHSVSALTCNMDHMASALRTLTYGKKGTDFYDKFPALFKAEDVKVNNPAVVNAPQPAKKTVDIAEKQEQEKYNQDALIKELEALQRKVHSLESDNSSLRSELSDKRKLTEDSEAVKEQLEAANREVAALRSYVYNLTEEDEPIKDIKLSEMKEFIGKLKIIIIGGHPNWVSKMKKEFSDWTFINPEASGSTDVSIVEKADYVFFFTDTISHSRYYQFLNVLRERKIEFGYIHSVNIEKNVRDVYMCVAEE